MATFTLNFDFSILKKKILIPYPLIGISSQQSKSNNIFRMVPQCGPSPSR